VVDEQTGKPITQFNVSLSFPVSRNQDDPDASLQSRLIKPGADGRSDDGSFTVGELHCRGVFSVIVSAEGYAQSRVDRVVAQPADKPGQPLIVKLGKGRTLSGSVVDAQTGRPVAGAEVVLVASPYPPQRDFYLRQLKDTRNTDIHVRRAPTGQDGSFEFPHVPGSGYRFVIVQTPEHAIHLTTNPPAEKPLAIQLSPGGTIEGTTQGVVGLDPKKAFVEAKGAGLVLEQLPVREDGTFRIDRVPAGDWFLTLMEDWRPKQKAKVKVAAGQTTRLDFARPPGHKVSGRVTRSGEPLEGVGVSITSAPEWLGSATTGAGGSYTIPGILPGDYTVRATRGQRPGRIEFRSTKWVTVTDRDVSVDFAFSSGRIEGRVLEAGSGKPLGGRFILAMRFEKPDAPPNKTVTLGTFRDRLCFGTSGASDTNSALLGLRATRDLSPAPYRSRGYDQSAADGSFSIENLEAGDYTLFISHRSLRSPGFLPRVRIERDGASASVEVRIRQDGSFKVKVLASDTREPVAGARIGLCTSAGVQLTASRLVRKPGVPEGRPLDRDDYTIERFQTDAQGAFSLDGLLDAEYGLWVVAPGFGARFVAPVPASPQAPETVVELRRAGVLILRPVPEAIKDVPNPYVAYRVCDASGRPVHPGGEISGGSPMETGVAKLFGKERAEWRIDTIPPGRYSVEWEIHQRPEPKQVRYWRTLPAVHRGEAEVEIRKGEEAVIQLLPGAGQ